MLLWDGSTPGDLTKSGPISASDFANVSKSLHSAMLFPKIASEMEWEHLSELRDKIEMPFQMRECLHGKVLAVSSVKGDQQISNNLKNLKSGMWLRLRNLHIDSPMEEIPYPSKLSGTGTPSSSSSTSSSSSSSSSLLFFLLLLFLLFLLLLVQTHLSSRVPRTVQRTYGAPFSVNVMHLQTRQT